MKDVALNIKICSASGANVVQCCMYSLLCAPITGLEEKNGIFWVTVISFCSVQSFGSSLLVMIYFTQEEICSSSDMSHFFAI